MEKPTAAHNPEVVGSSPAPATTKAPLSSRKAVLFFHFCNFFGRPHFLDTEVTQTVTHTGQKCTLAQLFRAKAFLLFGIIFPLSDCRRQDLLHGPGRLLLGRRGDVGVGVQGKPCREVPQHPGHRLDVYSVLKGQRSEGMPEVVEPDPRQSRPLQHPVEHMQDAVWRDWAAGR